MVTGHTAAPKTGETGDTEQHSLPGIEVQEQSPATGTSTSRNTLTIITLTEGSVWTSLRVKNVGFSLGGHHIFVSFTSKSSIRFSL